MKKPIFLIFAICVLTIIGCSPTSSESLDSDINSEEIQPAINATGTEFKIESTGVFETSDTRTCENAVQVFFNRGESSSAVLGLLKAEFNICTDSGENEFFNGFYIDDYGDEFWVSSVDSGIDERGKWNLLIIDGGTGIFENATGEITIHRLERFTTPDTGTFTDTGEGIINY